LPCALRRDCLTRGADGHPYLRYWNVKLKREAILPIALPFDGPLGEAAWMKERIARAKQALFSGHPDGAP
jgi:hypothetical protein